MKTCGQKKEHFLFTSFQFFATETKVRNEILEVLLLVTSDEKRIHRGRTIKQVNAAERLIDACTNKRKPLNSRRARARSDRPRRQSDVGQFRTRGSFHRRFPCFHARLFRPRANSVVSFVRAGEVGGREKMRPPPCIFNTRYVAPRASCESGAYY